MSFSIFDIRLYQCWLYFHMPYIFLLRSQKLSGLESVYTRDGKTMIYCCLVVRHCRRYFCSHLSEGYAFSWWSWMWVAIGSSRTELGENDGICWRRDPRDWQGRKFDSWHGVDCSFRLVWLLVRPWLVWHRLRYVCVVGRNTPPDLSLCRWSDIEGPISPLGSSVARFPGTDGLHVSLTRGMWGSSIERSGKRRMMRRVGEVR